MRTEINEPRLAVAGLFASQPYLTRFTSSMSADEMTEDPAFAFNADLLDVNNVHEATGIIYQCTPDGYYDYSNVKVRTPGGLLLDYTSGTGNADVIQRARGITVRQGVEPGAAVIERLPLSGPAIIQEDRSAEIAARHPDNGGNGGAGGNGGGPDAGSGGMGNGSVTADVGGDSGCGCRTTGGGANAAGFGLLAMLGLARRRNRRGVRASH
jgi:MYXO-CTERM domain-containing protein